ncbi:MAG: NFACT family protein, partial [Candidatus Marinimicrobia bacterium]|nr:NFACT family protein [Candidatus Neomarinimicrobiota bacterium]
MLNDLNILNLLAENFDSDLSGKKFHVGFTYRKNELLIIFGKKRPKTLFFNAAKNKPHLYLREGDFKPKRKQVVKLFKDLNGLELQSINASRTNRELSLQFEHGVSLQFVFFGYQPNAVLINDENKIMDSFKNSSKLSGRNYADEFPLLKKILIKNPADLKRIFKSNPSVKLSRALRNAFQSIDKTSAHEIVFLAGSSSDLKSHMVDDKSIKKIWQAYKIVTNAMSTADVRVYQTSPPILALFKPEHLAGDQQVSFDSANEAVIEFIKLQNSYDSLLFKKRDTLKSLQLKLNSVGERTKKQKADLIKLRERQDWDKIADVLMSNLHNLRKGMSEVSLSDFVGNEMVIKLDSDISPASNAQRYYKKAKAARSGEKKLLRAIREGEKMIPDLAKLVVK